MLGRLYDGHGDTGKWVDLLEKHGNGALHGMPELDKIFKCDRQYTQLEADVANLRVETAVGDQLKNVLGNAASTRKTQATRGFVNSAGEDAAQLFDSNTRSSRVDRESSAAHMHDTVFKALSKTAAESIRVLKGDPEPPKPCLPTPDGGTALPKAPSVKGLEGALKAAVASQVSKQVKPSVSCMMESVAADTGCYGHATYKGHGIRGGEWTEEIGGQYRLVGLDLKESSKACLADDGCKFIWISAADEINAKGWGSRALHECKRRPTPNHNLYEKTCMTPEERAVTVGRLSFQDVRKNISSRIAYRTGNVATQSGLPMEIFRALDKNGDTVLSYSELRRLPRVVDDRWAPQKVRRIEIKRPTPSLLSTPTRDRIPGATDMLRLFDEDNDGTISPSEQRIADSFTRRKTEL